MKKHLCFIFLLFVGGLSWAQTSNNKPKGQVVMRTTKAYNEIYNFGEVSELKPRKEETVSYFDKKGNIVYKRLIDYDGRTETAYIYTHEGKILKEITTTPKTTESAIIYDTLEVKLYTYDDFGRIKTESVFENKSLISKNRYEYTSTGYKQYRYEGDGSLLGVAEKKGNEISYTSKGKHSIQYLDNAGRVVRTSLFLDASNGGLSISVYNTYNKYGDLMCASSHIGSVIQKPQQTIVYSQRPDGSIVANLGNQYSMEQHKDDHTYRYEYDAKGNWTVKYDDNKKKRYVREIAYAKGEDDFGTVKQKIEEGRHTLDSVMYQIYQEKVLEQRRLKAAKEARQRYARQTLDAYIATQKVLYESRISKYKLIDQKERIDLYAEDYPYICATVRSCKDLLSISSKPAKNNLDAVFHPIDVYTKRFMDYINLQQTVIGSLINKNKKKENKELERSLKKAGGYTQRIAILSSWLKEHGYDLFQKTVKKDSLKSLYDEYYGYKKKIYSYKKSNNDELYEFACLGDLYVRARLGGSLIENYRGEPILENISAEHLGKCIEVQKLLYNLLTNDSLKEERTKLVERYEESLGYNLNRYNLNNINRPLWFALFEDYLKRKGIAILNNESENLTKN